MRRRNTRVVSLFLWIFWVCRRWELGCALNDEGKALLGLKGRVELDPYGALASWDEEDEDPCSWFGVGCCHDGRVVILGLKDLCLKGTLSPEISKLIHLSALLLHNNSFYGAVPEDIGKLQKLEVLDLGHNNFSGLLPPNLGDILSLEKLNLRGNRFAGNLSEVLCKLKMLSVIQIDEQLPSNKEFITAISDAVNANIRRNLADIKQNSTRFHKNLTNVNRTNDNRTSPYNRENPEPIPQPPLSPVLPPSQPPPHPSASPESPVSHGRSSNSALIISVSVGGAICFVIVLSIIYFYYSRTKKVVSIMPFSVGSTEKVLRAPATGIPALRRLELETACEGFSNIIGSFSKFTLYKGTLSNGVEIAVTSTTVASAEDWSEQDGARFKRKIKELSKINHKNFMNLLGHCKEEEPFTRMLVFEYAPNGTLFEHLHIKEAEQLNWSTRLRIAMGVAYCLEHMMQLNPPLFLRNLNSFSVCLTEDYAAKISDLGFWEVEAETNLATECSNESNIVYRFGILLLEMISGRLPYSEDDGLLALWASCYLSGKRPAIEMVDETLSSVPEGDVNALTEIIQSCINEDPEKRATISEVASSMRLITSISPEEAWPKQSPLWWAELQIISSEV